MTQGRTLMQLLRPGAGREDLEPSRTADASEPGLLKGEDESLKNVFSSRVKWEGRGRTVHGCTL